jgi:hypothetical protein
LLLARLRQAFGGRFYGENSGKNEPEFYHALWLK